MAEEKDKDELSFPFCNSKSITLFGFDLTQIDAGNGGENDIALNKLTLPQFVPLEKLESNAYEQ